MTTNSKMLSPSEAARRLAVSPKALRLYEERGLLIPMRTETGWRLYGPEQLDRASQIVGLRSVGLSLNEISRVLDGDTDVLGAALAGHEAVLEARTRRLRQSVNRIRELRRELARGSVPLAAAVSGIIGAGGAERISLKLPWPWDGETFELPAIGPLTYVVGPLFSGKTKLLEAIAGHFDTRLVEPNRGFADTSSISAALASDAALSERVHRAMAVIVTDGGAASDHLLALLAALEVEDAAILVVDMLEHGLDAPTQEALIAMLRKRGPDARPIVFTTRSTAILDLESVTTDETIIHCPANHSVPFVVAPYPGAPGYEALSMSLASPAARARTAGVIAVRPHSPAVSAN